MRTTNIPVNHLRLQPVQSKVKILTDSPKSVHIWKPCDIQKKINAFWTTLLYSDRKILCSYVPFIIWSNCPANHPKHSFGADSTSDIPLHQFWIRIGQLLLSGLALLQQRTNEQDSHWFFCILHSRCWHFVTFTNTAACIPFIFSLQN